MAHRNWLRFAFVVALIAGSAACSSGKANTTTSATGPCSKFRADDAKQLLGVSSVQRVSFTTRFKEQMTHTTETTTADAAAQIAAVDASSCAYRPGGESSPTASYQFDFATPSFFPSVEKFLDAMKPAFGDEVVTGIGQAAVYSVDAASSKASVIVLLAGGKNFVLQTTNTPARKSALVQAAKTIAGRL